MRWAVIMAFTTPNEVYEVEFLDEEGNRKAECTLLPGEIEHV